MKNLFANYLKTTCQVIVNEKDVTTILRVLSRRNISTNLSIGDCGWKKNSKWYILFNASPKQMSLMEPEFEQLGIGEIIVITGTNPWAKTNRLM